MTRPTTVGFSRTQVRQLTATPAACRSYWLQDALRTEPQLLARPTLRGDVRADVCIVGGGYTGLWTALELLRRDPSMSVVLLEASVCGAGASGTNAGFAMNLWPKLPALIAHGGTDEGPTVARASKEAVDYLVSFCADHDIDAQSRQTGWLWASTNSSQDASWDESVEAATKFDGSPFTVVGAQDATTKAGSPLRGGVLDDTCYQVHPGRLVRGLARVAQELGVVIHEQSPMVELERRPGGTRVRTASGSVDAETVVLAVNAWAARMPQYRPHLLMTASDNVVVRPRAPWPTTTMVSDSGRLLNYWRTMHDGNVLFGKGGTGLGYGVRSASTLFGPVPQLSRLRSQLAAAVPALADAEILSNWRAPVEYSLSSLPFFTQVDDHPGVYCGTGYSGDGVGPSVLGGRILASLATGTTDELSTSFLTRPPAGRGLPPEPARFLGGQLVKTAYLRRDRLEAADRACDPLTGLLTRVDPTSFVG
ncbi:hypothetical protein GCM10011492_09200 [Flexivirga endophytica]|uniref:FAD dependent oxidoreductase domain-containing protein n=1 Tax=Flexivirga endophytica TaxID=1849103 RepID=A0A916SZF8_9MICO|nr:FAD-dependent oxidoreductase [Flexivirga endophytica]GGB21432.1 hypothetical protein GCM10011492_09200 [Flexivirga endophytica]GHB59088.1 hypothetical protein GCM10008112_30220 [Flexivirga endophytica]